MIAGLAALPSLVLLAMNTVSWGSTDLETIVIAYRFVVYAGLAIALVAIWLAIRQYRRGGSNKALGITIAIAVVFIVRAGPDAYLDPTIRANMSTFALLSTYAVEAGLRALARDLASRTWQHRYAEILDLPELDVGYRIVLAEFA